MNCELIEDINFIKIREGGAFSVAEVAEGIKCSKTTVYNIENKKVTGGGIFVKYLKFIGFDAVKISKLRSGSLNQIDIEDSI